jgi:hypothetical protein
MRATTGACYRLAVLGYAVGMAVSALGEVPTGLAFVAAAGVIAMGLFFTSALGVRPR